VVKIHSRGESPFSTSTFSTYQPTAAVCRSPTDHNSFHSLPMLLIALLTLPDELRDMVLRFVTDSPQPELEFDQMALLSEDFVVSSAQTTVPANPLSACQQLREETRDLMKLRDTVPKIEVHIRDTSTVWEICTAWKVPPSACAHSGLRKHHINSMTVIKPRSAGHHSIHEA
jgi:hypothetical protein